MWIAKKNSRTAVIAWQILFIVLGTTWLWAPYLNHALDYRTALISQYETAFQPYSWLFRSCDVLAGLLLVLVAVRCLHRPASKVAVRLLLVIGAGMVLDPLLSTTCRVSGQVCQEYFSAGFMLHALETLSTAAAFFALTVYDAWRRKQLVSIVTVVFQIAYGALFVSQLAEQGHFNTLSQYIYQAAAIAWIAWFVRDFLAAKKFEPGKKELYIIKFAVAAWALANGILAIVLSLAHIQLLGRLRGLYFAGDSAWLAQHGVIIGVVMLYLSRHLVRGELRARQIFLAISGVEVLKYSVVSPHPVLMILYTTTFCGLFVLKDDFTRGTIPMTWAIRLRDLYFMVAALLVAILAALLFLDRDNKASIVTSRTFDNFFDYAARSVPIPRSDIASALLAHTISAFLFISIGTVLWILFRPYGSAHKTNQDRRRIKNILEAHSASSEDYFKLWPADKQYYMQQDTDGFIAYKLVGSTVFALADPVSDNQQQLVDNFLADNRSKRLKTCFLPVCEASMQLYENAGLELLQIGSSAVIDINQFLSSTANEKWWRWQKNRAVKQGYSYQQSKPPHTDLLIGQLRAVSQAWLSIDGHTERGFSLGYFNETYLQNCVIHYLHDQTGRVVAFTNEVSQFRPLPTVTVDLLRYLPDCNQTMPYLLWNTIHTAADVPGSKQFDLGFVPFARAKGSLLRLAKIIGGGRFSYSGLEQFKNKFKPEWQPNCIAYDGDLADLALIALNIEKAMDAAAP